MGTSSNITGEGEGNDEEGGIRKSVCYTMNGLLTFGEKRKFVSLAHFIKLSYCRFYVIDIQN